MPLMNSLAAVSTCMTYVIQVAFAYLVVWGLCLLVRNARARLQMLGCFLFLATSYWIFLVIPHHAVAPANIPMVTAAAPSQELVPGWSWAIPQWVAAHVSGVSSWALTAYITILLFLLLHLAFKSWALKRFLASGFDAPPDLNAVFEELCRDMGVGKCRLILMPGLRSPAMANWWRPYVLLPAELTFELDETQLANVLRHELIHIRRHDYLWDRLAAVACRMVFFHPVMWLAHRRLRWERELACDEAVVRHHSDGRVEYAECLTTLARWWFLADKNSPGAIGFASSASLLGTRVRALLVEPVACSIYQRGARAAVIVLVLAVTAMSLPGMRLSFYWSQPQERSAAESAAHSFIAARKSNRTIRRVISNNSQADASAHSASAGQGSTVGLAQSSELAVIDKPAMPVFAGLEQHSAPNDVSGASGGVATASMSGRGPTGLGPATSQPTVKKPGWQDTAVDAITTGVAIIRSRSSVPTGTTGAPGGGSSGGGPSVGGTSGGGGGGEGPDHFTGPN